MKAFAPILLVAVLPMAVGAAPSSHPPGAVMCIDGQHFDSRRAEDERTVVFSDGTRSYRNHLKTECPGVMRLNDSFGMLITELHGSQLCSGDSIRVADTSGIRVVGPQAYPRCVLGWFEPLPPKPKR